MKSKSPFPILVAQHLLDEFASKSAPHTLDKCDSTRSFAETSLWRSKAWVMTEEEIRLKPDPEAAPLLVQGALF